MTEQQRKDQLEKLARDNHLQKALKAMDPSLARGIYLDKELNWLCKECPYAKDCETMRGAGAAA